MCFHPHPGRSYLTEKARFSGDAVDSSLCAQVKLRDQAWLAVYSQSHKERDRFRVAVGFCFVLFCFVCHDLQNLFVLAAALL